MAKSTPPSPADPPDAPPAPKVETNPPAPRDAKKCSSCDAPLAGKFCSGCGAKAELGGAMHDAGVMERLEKMEADHARFAPLGSLLDRLAAKGIKPELVSDSMLDMVAGLLPSAGGGDGAGSGAPSVLDLLAGGMSSMFPGMAFPTKRKTIDTKGTPKP